MYYLDCAAGAEEVTIDIHRIKSKPKFYDIPSCYEPSLSPEELKFATENKAAIVSVSTPTTGSKHTLIVDGFKGDYALIRDPLLEGHIHEPKREL